MDQSPPPMGVHSRPWLRAASLRRLFDAFEANEDIRVVGGAVRDSLLDLPVGDIDLATPLPPNTVIERLNAARLRAVPTGIEHGTVTAVVDGEAFQITTLREDVETDGRHAIVRFGTSWRADAQRRDFTLNALYLDSDGHLHDPIGGYGDCLARRIRFIGDPSTRIREDYLRILRFFRFQASHGVGPADEPALAAIAQLGQGLHHVSRERIGHEVKRLVLADGAVSSLAAMQATGCLDVTFSGLTPDLDRFAAVRGAADRLGWPLRSIDGLIALLAPGDQRQDSQWIDVARDSLRLTRSETADIKSLVGQPGAQGIADAACAHEARYRLGRERARIRLLLDWAASGNSKDAFERSDWSRLVPIIDRKDDPVFPVTPQSLMELGVPPNAELGASLRRLESLWINAGYNLSAAELLRDFTQNRPKT